MNKTERDELRRIIRARFKVLRADIDARKAELLAELEAGISAQFAAQDKQWTDAQFLVEEALREANRKVNDVYRGVFGAETWGDKADHNLVYSRPVTKPEKERTTLRAQGYRDIEAKVKTALLELERREVDLLADLATTALESAESKAFMVRIPTVSELVPASRLAEIAAAILDEEPS